MRKIVITISVLIALATGVFVITRNDSKVNYQESILDHRNKISDFMKGSSESPFANQNVEYRELSYYAPDPTYRIEADYIPIGNRQPLSLATSDGKEENYEKYGYATFQLQGKSNKLLLLRSLESSSDYLFIPFADQTSGSETYGGGRYLNVTLTEQEHILLDFNKAYNPYCAYNENYSCPLPPKENRLNITIKAGEKNYD